jgi:hypothetical protein
MSYSRDFRKSAARNFRAAEELMQVDSGGGQPGCKAVAGYLFGLAGESAIKQIMLDSGMEPNPTSSHDCPFWAHFPNLKSLLLNTIKGRRAGELRQFAESSSFFGNWAIAMRYAPTQEILDRDINAWKANAQLARDRMDR